MTLQSEHFESELRRLLEQHKEEMKNLELRFLDAKQDLKRSESPMYMSTSVVLV